MLLKYVLYLEVCCLYAHESTRSFCFHVHVLLVSAGNVFVN